MVSYYNQHVPLIKKNKKSACTITNTSHVRKISSTTLYSQFKTTSTTLALQSSLMTDQLQELLYLYTKTAAFVLYSLASNNLMSKPTETSSYKYGSFHLFLFLRIIYSLIQFYQLRQRTKLLCKNKSVPVSHDLWNNERHHGTCQLVISSVRCWKLDPTIRAEYQGANSVAFIYCQRTPPVSLSNFYLHKTLRNRA